MLDHIDLEQSARAANTRQRKTWWTNARTVGILLVIGAFLMLMEFVLPSGLFKKSSLYSLLTLRPGGSWQVLENVPADPIHVWVTPSNTVWVASYDTLSRFDGAAWTTYSAADYGAQRDADTLFALAGEEVWVTSGRSVSHFAGGRWVNFPNVIGQYGAIAITASGSHVWVLEWGGDLMHYDGKQWGRTSLPPSSSAADYEYSTLAATPEGALWLTLDGLWRFDGQKWEAIPTSTIPADVAILTLAGDRLWLNSYSSLFWISADRATSGQVSGSALTLKSAEYINLLAVRDTQLWVTTSLGILAFDGTTWQRLPPPGSNLTPIDVTTAPDGTLWAIFMKPPTQTTLLSTSWPFLIGLCAVGALLMALVFVRPFLAARTQVQQRTDARAVIRRALPDLPERNLIGPNGTIFYLILVLILFFNPLRAFILWFFPALSAEMGILIASLVWVVLLTAGKRLFDRLRHPGAAFIALFRNELAGSVFLALYLLAAVAAFQALIGVLQTISLNAILTFAVYGALAILVILVVPRVLTPLITRRYSRIITALNNADYEEAKRLTLLNRRAQPRAPAWLFMQGTTLLFEGHSDGAEPLLREALAEGLQWAPVRLLVSILINLASALADQKRYEEALPLYEAAAEIDPAYDLPFLGVAEIYLQQGINPERALKLLELARANKLRNMKVDRHTWGTILACQAWALTLLNQPDQVLTLLAQALRETNQQFKPGLAALNYRVGRVLSLRGDYDSAEQQLKLVSQLDPVGRSARDAAEALQEIDKLRKS
jgi:tetratricopeptide (TPR) repeat protein